MQFPFLFFWWAAIALHWNVITLATISCNGNLSSQEYDALNSLFVSANGENWRWHTDGGQKWYFPSPLSAPCTNGWQGLTCVRRLDSVDCSIINLQLSDHNLVGQIPPELGNLTSILELDLRANFLSGSVPYHLTDLKKLNAVSLALNFLTGHIPSQIGRLVSSILTFRIYEWSLTTVLIFISGGIKDFGSRVQFSLRHASFCDGLITQTSIVVVIP